MEYLNRANYVACRNLFLPATLFLVGTDRWAVRF
jgi:hypothetical protein